MGLTHGCVSCYSSKGDYMIQWGAHNGENERAQIHVKYLIFATCSISSKLLPFSMHPFFIIRIHGVAMPACTNSQKATFLSHQVLPVDIYSGTTLKD